jgi:CubicO group peptidase (beta-lactamase class C family)
VVIRNGWVAAEWGRTTPFRVASASKSLTGLAVAKLLDLAHQGAISTSITLKSPLYPFLPAAWAAADPRRRLIQIGHALSMTSGLVPDDTPEEANHLGVILTQPVHAAPATRWSYASLPVDLLGMAVQAIAAKPLGDLFNQQVGVPIGMARIAWTSFNGYTKACDGAALSARDMARVGYLMLRGGVWNDGSGQQQVVSKSAVKALHAKTSFASKAKFEATPGSPFPIDDTSPAFYGQLWWLNRTRTGLGPAVPTDAFYARGYRETLLVVVPSLDLVVVRYGDLPLALNAFGRELMARVMAAVTG